MIWLTDEVTKLPVVCPESSKVPFQFLGHSRQDKSAAFVRITGFYEIAKGIDGANLMVIEK